MSTAPGGATPTDVDRWQRVHGIRVWDTFFVIDYTATIGLVLADDMSIRSMAAAVLIVALAAWFWSVGRRLTIHGTEDGSRVLGYLIVIVALFTAASLTAPASSFLLFALSAQCFIMLRLSWAIGTVAVLNITPMMRALRAADDTAQLVTLVAIGVVCASFAVLLGVWISRVVVQSQERAELIGRLESAQEEVARLSREAGTLSERERLAAEIHDTLAQGFTSLLMLVQAADAELDRAPAAARRHLTAADRTARENLDEARNLIAALRPAALESGSLDHALRRLVERVGAETGTDATYTADGPGGLPAATEVVLLRGTQEALTNVGKHAAAQHVTVCLHRTGDRATLTISDDGVGFDPAASAQGYGLVAMRTRVRQLGGVLEVHSAAGEGTDVLIEVPA